MSFKPRVTKPKVTLFKCKTCKRRYNNRLKHTCIIRTDFKKRRRAA